MLERMVYQLQSGNPALEPEPASCTHKDSLLSVSVFPVDGFLYQGPHSGPKGSPQTVRLGFEADKTLRVHSAQLNWLCLSLSQSQASQRNDLIGQAQLSNGSLWVRRR